MDDGDSIAFSVEKQRPLYGGTAQRNRTDVTTCLLRVDRRRTDRRPWERMMEETARLRALNFVTQLERHRFEYRVSVARCDDVTLLVLPLHLHVSRRYGMLNGEHDVHIGSFRLVRMRARSPITIAHFEEPSPLLWVMGFVIAVLFGAVIWATRRGYQHADRQHALKQSSCVKQDDDGCKMRQSDLPYRRHLLDIMDVTSNSDDGDRVEKEILTAELPEVNDEDGWRDFFDAHIYGRYHSDGQETRGESEVFNKRPTDLTTPRPAVGQTRLQLKKTVPRSRNPSHCKTNTNGIHSVALSTSNQQSPSDEFGEFWQM